MKKPSSRKRNLTLSAAVTTAAVFSLRPALVEATTFYWDTNGVTAGQGSTVTASWLTFNNWATVPGGLGATSTWANTNPNSDTALFQAMALTLATVVVNGTVFVNSMQFDSGTYLVASTGGNYVNLSGTNPTINVNVTGTATVNFGAPLTGSNGLTVTGAASGTHVLYLNNADGSHLNNFTGNLTVTSTGFVRLFGNTDGTGTNSMEQIPDNDDLSVNGILDFNTSGSNSDGKQEKVHNVTVTGSSSNFSVGNGSNFVMNSATITSSGTGQGISLNGNVANNPSRLTINGWDGGGDLKLNDGTLKMNSTGALGSTGGSVVSLTGNLTSTGNSMIYNVNGAAGLSTNVFPYQNFVFASAAHTIDVTGVLLMTSSAANHPLEILSSAGGGTTLTKTGPGEWILAYAAETTFTGTTRISQGTLTLAASERLADTSTLNIAGGALNMGGFNETVGSVVLDSGTIMGGGVLTSTQGFAIKSGSVTASLAGAGDLVKSTSSQFSLTQPNTYTGKTRMQAGTLLVSGTVGTGTLAVEGGFVKFPGGAPTSTVKGLSIASGGSLDLSYNSMVIDYTGGSGAGSLALLRGYIAAGSFNSSSAGTVLGLNFRLGYRDNQDTGPGLIPVASFGGVPVDASSVLITLAIAGDTNLDGRVDVADLNNMASHYNVAGNWNWEQGDMNYDGTVNLVDLKMLAASWVWPAGSGLAPALGPLLTSLGLPDVAVPEPATFTLGAMGCACLMTRKRRSRSTRFSG